MRRLLAVLVLCGVLAGCDANQGTALADAFERDWAGTADVAEIETQAENTLPFAGAATGTLVLEDGTSERRVADLADELAGYLRDHDSVSGRITADDVTFDVVEDADDNEQIVALWSALAADERVSSADLTHTADDSDTYGLQIQVPGVPAAVAVFVDLITDGGRYDRPNNAARVTVGTADVASEVATSYEGAVPAAALAAYRAVAAEFEVTAAWLSTERTAITVARPTDRKPAARLARRAAPTAPGLRVSSDS